MEEEMTRSARSTLVALAVSAIALMVPALASAAKPLWVGKSAAGANSSCASPGYNTVQAALDAAGPGGKVYVCAGTYEEQVEIVKPVNLGLAPGSGSAKLQMPSTPADSLTSCDTAEGLEAGQKDEVSICTTGKVTLYGLSINAVAPIETCGGGLNAINVAGGAELTATDDTVVGASSSLAAFKGCQHGVAIEVGSHKANEVGHAKLDFDAISGYEKNGPTATNPGSTLSIKGSRITGEGPSPYIAQNGIEVAFGAKGTISETDVTGNECEVEGVCSSASLGEQATGVLFFGAATGSKLAESTISGNDIGVYYASTSPTQPAKPEVKLTFDNLISNRFEGAVLEEGDASLVGATINGTGQVGIDIVQSASQPYADDSSATGATIEGMSVAAVAVTTDNAPGDPVGTFTIKNSSISKNAAEVSNSSSNFTVVKKNDS
jgi:hypothetical protein